MLRITITFLALLAITACGFEGAPNPPSGPDIPDPVTTPTAITEFPGALYYVGYWQVYENGTSGPYDYGLTRYNFSEQREEIKLSKKGVLYTGFGISQDGSTGLAAMGYRFYKIVDLDASQTQFVVDHSGPTKLVGNMHISPNNKMVLHQEEVFPITYLRIRDKDGIVMSISHREFSDETHDSFGSYFWVNDSEFIFQMKGHLYHMTDISTQSYYELINYGPLGFTVIGYFTISPDGTKLAYIGTKSGQNEDDNSNLYISDFDGSNEIQLTANSDIRSPTWSPDGKHIAVIAGPFYGHADYSGGICPEAYIVPTDLTTPTTINYSNEYDPTVTHKLKLVDFVNDVCIDGPFIEWADK